MKVRVQSGGILKAPVATDAADSVVVYTNEGDPVMIALDMEGKVWIKTLGDPDFASTWELLGFSRNTLPAVTQDTLPDTRIKSESG